MNIQVDGDQFETLRKFLLLNKNVEHDVYINLKFDNKIYKPMRYTNV